MIPTVHTLLSGVLESEEQPSRTYRMHYPEQVINGYQDEIKAMQQAIFKILNTERYQHLIYSQDYGMELLDLFGEPVSYVCPELERRIAEALLQDERIHSVDSFSFDLSKKGVVKVRFTAHTLFGELEAEKEVVIGV